MSTILMPLIFSSLERIETVSCAMELRAFGNKKKRTWYSGRKFRKPSVHQGFLNTTIFCIVVEWW